ncbi:DUF732 domain-containing protein [Mycobacterium botniense]|uniref:DUF732 domain-containing protein n=1 Tax=Mycobacterium botniense TaxID=84962 RepID=A0A7I9Y358_9MYCO|nr:DUF732 domain-containing protein [Mycobacterium botniense]GFG76509.1 hypothetical protein MBOT_38740 [Mycobacterium botniense]
MLKGATLAAGLAVAAVCLAAPAAASESGYLARLDKAQVSHMSPEDALHWGYAACDSLRNGTPVRSTIDMLKNAGGFSGRHAGTVVGAAASELCPDQYQNVMDWAHAQTGA